MRSCSSLLLGFGLLGLGLILPSCGVEEIELRPRSGEGAGSTTPESASPEPEGVDVLGASVVNIGAGAGIDRARSESLVPSIDLDLPPGDFDDFQAPPAPETGCNKVDFLFVVDNSFSMLQDQSNLVASFPDFMQVIGANVRATDFHILVTDTDGWDGIGSLFEVDPCRDALGAGKRLSADGRDCGIEGSDRYMVASQPELSETFACVARVGTFGSIGEQPMDSLLQAISPAANDSAGCNAGFLRDDAILVVTIITDEDDTRSSGDPEIWRQALIDAKGGDEQAVVVLGLVGDNNLDDGLPGGPCGLLDADGAPALQSFVQSLPHGSLASVCAPTYGSFFEQAVDVIDSACEAFVPPIR